VTQVADANANANANANNCPPHHWDVEVHEENLGDERETVEVWICRKCGSDRLKRFKPSDLAHEHGSFCGRAGKDKPAHDQFEKFVKENHPWRSTNAATAADLNQPR
jgi:hypothetical protein